MEGQFINDNQYFIRFIKLDFWGGKLSLITD